MNRLLELASRSNGRRSWKWSWQSKSENVTHDGSLWGELVTLEISHDEINRKYKATMRLVHTQKRENCTITQFTLMDKATYPAVQFASVNVSRYSEKSLAQFKAEVLDALDDYRIWNDTVGVLFDKVEEITAHNLTDDELCEAYDY